MSTETLKSDISSLAEIFKGTFVRENDESYQKHLEKVARDVEVFGKEKVHNILLGLREKTLHDEPMSDEEIKVLRGAESALAYAPGLEGLNEQLTRETRSDVEEIYGPHIDALISKNEKVRKSREQLLSRAASYATSPFGLNDKDHALQVDVKNNLTLLVERYTPKRSSPIEFLKSTFQKRLS